MSINLTASWLLSAALVLILDQVSKRIVLKLLDKALVPPIYSWLRIRPVNNVNIGFGFIRNSIILILLWGVVAFGNILLANWFAPLQKQIALVGLGAAFGGATGNLMDMLRRGAVIDFIDLRIWPVFNLADTAIITGVLVSIWSLLVVG